MSLPTVDRQAARFSAVREAHQIEVAEDYVELIDDLIANTGEARAVDLAARLGVSQATVNKTIKRLAAEGLVASLPYRSIFLTAEGEAMAKASRQRHRIVLDFLLAIGVSRETAEIDAEGVEHHVSRETLAAMQRVVETRSLPAGAKRR